MHPFTKSLKIGHLKRKGAKIYHSINAIYDTYDCGAAMINHITGGRLTRKETQFNAVMDQLETLDDETPTFRFGTPKELQNG